MVSAMKHKLIFTTLLLMFLQVHPTFADKCVTTRQWWDNGMYYNGKNYDNAIICFTKAIEINDEPNMMPSIYWFRGTAYDKQGKYDLAVSDYSKAIELATHDYDSYIKQLSYNYRGWIYYKLRTYDPAMEDFNKAIEINPSYAIAYNNRGLTYYQKGQYDLALADYEKCIQLNRGIQETEWAYSNRALIYLNNGKYDLAIKDADKAIELKRNDAVPYFIKADILNSWGKKQEAIDVLQTFVQCAISGDYNIDIAKERIRVLDQPKLTDDDSQERNEIVLLKSIAERIHPSLPEFIFKIYGYKEKYFIKVRKLEISKADEPNKIFQEIIFPKTQVEKYPEMMGDGGFIIEDVNFDGYKDLRLQQWVTTGANVPFRYWVWDKDTSQFILNNELEQILTPKVDHENKKIISYFRDGAASHTKFTYEYIDGHITQTQMIQTIVDSRNNIVHITTAKLQNGNVVTKKYDKPYPPFPSYEEIEQDL